VDADSSPPSSSVLLPRAFGRYVLFDFIGRGAMAELYLAREAADREALRLYLVKQLLPEHGQQPDVVETLLHEAGLAAQLGHPNIVSVFELGREEGAVFVATEYVEGFDLDSLLRRCARQKVPLPLELAVYVVMSALRALDYAHRRPDRSGRLLGIVHRDVSPSNVLISFDGEVKVSDFGIARANALVRRDGSQDDALAAKASYMSPEHAQGEVLDPRADVFAVGIILWELLAGRRLYRAPPGAPRSALFEIAKRAEIPPLPTRGIPRETELHAIVSRALMVDRGARFPSAGAMLRELEAYAAAAGRVANPLKLASWLTQHFGADVVEQRRMRDNAAATVDRAPMPSAPPLSSPYASVPGAPRMPSAPPVPAYLPIPSASAPPPPVSTLPSAPPLPPPSAPPLPPQSAPPFPSSSAPPLPPQSAPPFPSSSAPPFPSSSALPASSSSSPAARRSSAPPLSPRSPASPVHGVLRGATLPKIDSPFGPLPPQKTDADTTAEMLALDSSALESAPASGEVMLPPQIAKVIVEEEEDVTATVAAVAPGAAPVVPRPASLALPPTRSMFTAPTTPLAFSPSAPMPAAAHPSSPPLPLSPLQESAPPPPAADSEEDEMPTRARIVAPVPGAGFEPRAEEYASGHTVAGLGPSPLDDAEHPDFDARVTPAPPEPSSGGALGYAPRHNAPESGIPSVVVDEDEDEDDDRDSDPSFPKLWTAPARESAPPENDAPSSASMPLPLVSGEDEPVPGEGAPAPASLDAMSRDLGPQAVASRSSLEDEDMPTGRSRLAAYWALFLLVVLFAAGAFAVRHFNIL